MAKRRRYIPPGSLVEVSNRAVGSRFLLKPSREANELIAGVLARAARLYPAMVAFFVVPFSHFHLLLVVEREGDRCRACNHAPSAPRLYECRTDLVRSM